MGKLYHPKPALWPSALDWLRIGENCTALEMAVAQRANIDCGMLEVPLGSNRGFRIDEYTRRAGLPVPKNKKTNEGWYWCALACGAWLADCGALVPEEYPSCDAWLDHLLPGGPAAKNVPTVAVVLYGVKGDAHHIGLRVRLDPMILTIEGNRGFAGTTNNGVAVDLGPLNRKDVLGYFLLRSA